MKRLEVGHLLVPCMDPRMRRHVRARLGPQWLRSPEDDHLLPRHFIGIGACIESAKFQFIHQTNVELLCTNDR